jgi:hypothetical protein
VRTLAVLAVLASLAACGPGRTCRAPGGACQADTDCAVARCAGSACACAGAYARADVSADRCLTPEGATPNGICGESGTACRCGLSGTALCIDGHCRLAAQKDGGAGDGG